MLWTQTYNRIVESYTENLRRRTADANVSKLGRYVYRPISFVLTVPFAILGISANQVTVSSVGIFGAASFLLSSGDKSWMFAGAGLYLFFLIMDFIDGNLARVFRNATVLGKLLDGFVDGFATLIFVPVAFGLTAHHEPWFLTSRCALALAIATSFAFLLNTYFRLRLTHMMSAYNLAAKSDEGATSKAPSGFSLKKLGQSARKEALMATPLVLFAALFTDALEVFVVFYFIVHVVVGGMEIVLTVVKYRGLLNTPTAWARELWKQSP